jgi:hypothetical protein
MSKFVVKKNGELLTYTSYEDIPSNFDHVIEFMPTMPEPPHTEEQHEEMEKCSDRLAELMERERASSN